MSSNDTKPTSWALITVIIVIVLGMFLVWKFLFSNSDSGEVTQIIETPIITEPTINEPVTNEVPSEPITRVDELTVENTENQTVEAIQENVETKTVSITPALDQSDSWVQQKLLNIIWKKELLELLIDDDIIRRFVVFVDNFSQGNIVYSHSPFIKPSTSFIGKQQLENNTISTDGPVYEFDESSFKRFTIYVDLLRAADTEILVEWYKELQPLISEAYSELGYPDKEFKEVLQSAILKVLDLDFPKENIELVQPSVMYQYKSPEIEALDDADKLMLRIGKDNLLIIKSVLLEINEKINKI